MREGAERSATQGTDLEWLEAFAYNGDELAFRQIVEKYRRMVYSVALRRCGHRELAEEATQNTFAVLARKSKHLLQHPTLSGWLHRTAMLEASTLLRSERTRRRKHVELMERETLHNTYGAASLSLDAPPLDEALARLSARDRDVILMRFYEGMSFGEIGQRLGKSDAACQRRSHRAVKKLSRLLSKNGAPAVGGAAIAHAASARLAGATPLSSSGTITKFAVARSADIALSTLAINTLNTMNYTKTIAVAVITLALLIPIGLQSKESARLERETAAVRKRVGGLEQQRSRRDGESRQRPPAQLSALKLPDGEMGKAREKAAEAEASTPRALVTEAFAKLKREEIFYQRKYADGVPEPEDPGYADYISEMDGFMRLLAESMMVVAANESAMEFDDPMEKVEFATDTLREAIELDDATSAKIGAIISELFVVHGAFMGERNSRPEDPELVPEWEAANERVLGSVWDDIHGLLSPEKQLDFQYGFPRRAIVGRSINLGFPGAAPF